LQHEKFPVKQKTGYEQTVQNPAPLRSDNKYSFKLSSKPWKMLAPHEFGTFCISKRSTWFTGNIALQPPERRAPSKPTPGWSM